MAAVWEGGKVRLLKGRRTSKKVGCSLFPKELDGSSNEKGRETVLLYDKKGRKMGGIATRSARGKKPRFATLKK